ncbi:MAG: heme exporter protein CcmB [Balneolales bacterium]
MKWFYTTQAVLMKDVQLELRSKYALNTVLAFVAGSLLIVLFSLRAEELPITARSGLIWIIILFASLSVLGRSFIAETERGTFDLLRLHGEPSAVYTGKLIFNFLFTLLVTFLTILVYLFMLNITVYHPWLLVFILFFGTLGLAGVSTILGAVVSQASQKGTIYSVLSLPLLVPLILLLVRTTESAFSEELGEGLTDDMLAMVGFAGVVISISVILFDFIWEE